MLALGCTACCSVAEIEDSDFCRQWRQTELIIPGWKFRGHEPQIHTDQPENIKISETAAAAPTNGAHRRGPHLPLPAPRPSSPRQEGGAASFLRLPLQLLPGRVHRGLPAVVRLVPRRRRRFLIALLCATVNLGSVRQRAACSDLFLMFLAAAVGVGAPGGEAGAVSTSRRAVRT